jgi:hypothetical protein
LRDIEIRFIERGGSTNGVKRWRIARITAASADKHRARWQDNQSRASLQRHESWHGGADAEFRAS